MHVLALCITLRLMKKIRLLILLILSITLPSLGLASVNLMAQCSTLTEMTTSGPTAMPGMSAMTDSPDDCMTPKSDMSSKGKQQGGQNCKFGANCNLSTILTSFVPLTLSSPYQDNVLPTPETPFSPALEGQWRPPRSV